MNNTRTTPLEFMSHLRAWKSPRQISVASGEARRAAHLEGDSLRQGAHGGKLGVSKHGSFLLTGEPLANGETHNFGDKGSSWCFQSWVATKGKQRPQTAGCACVYVYVCVYVFIYLLQWKLIILDHGCLCFFLASFVCSYQKKLVPKGEDVNWHWCFLFIRSQFIVRRQQFGILGWSEGSGQVLTGGGLRLRRTRADRHRPLRRDSMIRCDWVLGQALVSVVRSGWPKEQKSGAQAWTKDGWDLPLDGLLHLAKPYLTELDLEKPSSSVWTVVGLQGSIRDGCGFFHVRPSPSCSGLMIPNQPREKLTQPLWSCKDEVCLFPQRRQDLNQWKMLEQLQISG